MGEVIYLSDYRSQNAMFGCTRLPDYRQMTSNTRLADPDTFLNDPIVHTLAALDSVIRQEAIEAITQRDIGQTELEDPEFAAFINCLDFSDWTFIEKAHLSSATIANIADAQHVVGLRLIGFFNPIPDPEAA